jgi:hypothetical protein
MFFYLIVQGACQRLALPACGRGRRSRPARKRLRRRKRLIKRGESPASGARFVRWLRIVQDLFPETRTMLLTDLILHARQFFTSPTLFWKTRLTYQNARAEDLLKPLLKTDFTKKLLCQKKQTWQKSLNQTCRNFS